MLLKDNVIYHVGQITNLSDLKIGDHVLMNIDQQARIENARNHTAGHLIDVAMKKTEGGFDLKPGKGYHFPDSPYVEYFGVVTQNEREHLKDELNSILNQLI